MSDKIFGQSIEALRMGLNASSLRGKVIQNNIANAETPGYKRQSVDFEAIFRQALDDQEGFVAKKTRDKHFDFGGDEAEITGVVTYDDSTMRMDENNVDVEYEFAELAKNQIYYSTLTEKLNSELRRLRMAIRE